MENDRHLRLLLVDDEPDILLLLQTILAASCWEIVGKADHGESAIRIASDLTPDVAIIDYMMPDMNGLELAERLKSLHPDCDTVLFSAFATLQEATASPYVDHFLSKGDVDRLVPLLTEIGTSKGLE